MLVLPDVFTHDYHLSDMEQAQQSIMSRYVVRYDAKPSSKGVTFGMKANASRMALNFAGSWAFRPITCALLYTNS
ncbi:uncharacterized protein PHALS_09323 [Plasmopara halstedii]|uniref:Uncharacterized protein n=1 Tax=Plasmopara halstedii TaxID=4781 RepID=A0A0P1AFB5_PLAHL|nr:uncharacterized protein PHALS_09323 [Plasmopara halstedii]CEG39272.1 hypothetical protein PHALS_09323 [Plasmopara halstedii]|eukprot:XP_024575641.1 hypothetical protein PHALS_09323 [Plasmopara halstedii]